MKKKLSVLIFVLLLVVAVMAIIAFRDRITDIPNNNPGITDNGGEMRLGAEAYSIGAITDEGEIDNSSKKSIYTRDMIVCEDITDILVLGAVDYAMAFYNKAGEFIGKEDYTIWIRAMAMSEDDFSEIYGCRIIITPRDDEEITSLEIIEYANMLEVWIKK